MKIMLRYTLDLLLLVSLCTAAATKTNTDDMWIAAPIGDLPAGVTPHTYHIESMKRDIGYCVYLPPGYAKGRYPNA